MQVKRDANNGDVRDARKAKGEKRIIIYNKLVKPMSLQTGYFKTEVLEWMKTQLWKWSETEDL